MPYLNHLALGRYVGCSSVQDILVRVSLIDGSTLRNKLHVATWSRQFMPKKPNFLPRWSLESLLFTCNSIHLSLARSWPHKACNIIFGPICSPSGSHLPYKKRIWEGGEELLANHSLGSSLFSPSLSFLLDKPTHALYYATINLLPRSRQLVRCQELTSIIQSDQTYLYKCR
jgi:hypothetical protein